MKSWRLKSDDLRWRCDPAQFDFRTTREVEPANLLLGQRTAVGALEMGLALDGPGYNLFVCGINGTRKISVAEELVRSRLRGTVSVPDRCYVQNFADPRRPRLLEMTPGKGPRLQKDVAGLLTRLQVDLDKVPESKWRVRADATLAARLPKLLDRYSADPPVCEWLLEWRRLEDFEVNSLGQPARTRGRRVVVETQPTYANLFGWIGRRAIGDQQPVPHFTEIRRGSFLEADGGVLIVDAIELLNHHGAWAALENCLKYGTLEFHEADPAHGSRTGALKPEPIPVRVKVVLVGDFALHDYLFDVDPAFAEVFKVRVDFPSEMDLTQRTLRRDYPALVASICETAELRPVAASGVARVVEYAVRRAGRKNKVTTHASDIEDLLREADYWATKSSRRTIIAADVDHAIEAAIDRVNLVEKRIAEMIADGTILISTQGSRVGQVNGLAIWDMGDYFFGKPSRITAETSVGQGGIINIERESGFSGRSHDKGVQILAGYLRSRFAQNRPLSLTASVCFEQSYSGIDGDSASATEIYAILSSLSGLPIRQDVAVTGSVSQKGDVQPIGGVNEKIEGFFDCVMAGTPSGREGVIIPEKNVADLMLRRDVVQAVERGRFHIYAIDAIEEGIEILTGVEAGERGDDGRYPKSSVFRRVDDRLEEIASDLRRYRSVDNGSDVEQNGC